MATNRAKLCKNTHNSSRRLSNIYGPEICVSPKKAKPVPQLFPLKQRSSMWAAALFIDTPTKNSTDVSLHISVTECSIPCKTSSLTCAPNRVIAYSVFNFLSNYGLSYFIYKLLFFISFSSFLLGHGFPQPGPGDAVPSNGLCAPGNQWARKNPGWSPCILHKMVITNTCLNSVTLTITFMDLFCWNVEEWFSKHQNVRL